MVHCVRISGGRAVLCSRYVRTYKYIVERDAGHPFVPNFFSCGTRLYALGESDLPYSIRLTSNGDIETLGRHDFEGKLSISITANPKIDPETGKAFSFRFGPMPPFLTYFRFDSNSMKQPDVPVRLDPSKVPRIGVIPRYAKDESGMRWFDVPGFNIMHAINAWDEDDDAIVMLAPNLLSTEHALERMELLHISVEKVRIDPKTGIVTRQSMSTRNLEFGVINSAYVGKKNNSSFLFIFCNSNASVKNPMPRISGVVKLDVSNAEHKECSVASRMFGPGCYGGKPFFVAREPNNPEADEDDEYLVSHVHNEKPGNSGVTRIFK
ncbi:hypothetical protein ACFX1R_012838 [Malus domestica]